MRSKTKKRVQSLTFLNGSRERKPRLMTHSVTHTPQKGTPRPIQKSAGFRNRKLVPETGLEPVRGCPNGF